MDDRFFDPRFGGGRHILGADGRPVGGVLQLPYIPQDAGVQPGQAQQPQMSGVVRPSSIGTPLNIVKALVILVGVSIFFFVLLTAGIVIVALSKSSADFVLDVFRWVNFADLSSRHGLTSFFKIFLTTVFLGLATYFLVRIRKK